MADEHGRPLLIRLGPLATGAAPAISIAHADGVAIALAVLDPAARVGIDVESIVERPAGFETTAFTTGERALLDRWSGPGRAEWVARFWCAKEAAAKASGLGLAGGPAGAEVVEVHEETGVIHVRLAPELETARHDAVRENPLRVVSGRRRPSCLGLDHWRRNQTVISVPSRTEILDDIITVLEKELGVQSSSPITEDTRFFADLGLASIDAVVLSERLQEHYGRSLPFNELMAEIGGEPSATSRSASWSHSSRRTSEYTVNYSGLDENYPMPKLKANGLNFHYQQAGSGPDVLLDPRRHGRPVDLVLVRSHGRARPLVPGDRLRPARPRLQRCAPRWLHLGRPGRRRRWRSWTPSRSTAPCWSAIALGRSSRCMRPFCDPTGSTRSCFPIRRSRRSATWKI